MSDYWKGVWTVLGIEGAMLLLVAMVLWVCWLYACGMSDQS